jgi:Phage antitermination protein Q
MLATITKRDCMESNHLLATQLLLEQWARWRHLNSGEVRGYPREVPFYRMMRGTAISQPYITDVMGEQVDGAVTRLCNRCPDQGEAVKLRYLEGHSPGKIGRQIGVGETKARDLLRCGVIAIEWILEGNR